jgi:hypothetical protein
MNFILQPSTESMPLQASSLPDLGFTNLRAEMGKPCQYLEEETLGCGTSPRLHQKNHIQTEQGTLKHETASHLQWLFCSQTLKPIMPTPA